MVRDKHVPVVVEFQMRDKTSLKPMVWNRIISTGKLFDAMYTFVGMPFRQSDDALMLIE